MAQIHEAICSIMKEIEPIGKAHENASQHYRFRGIDDAYNELQPRMATHGIFSVPQVLEERSEERTSLGGSALIYRILKMRYTFFAADGSSVEAAVIGEGMDTGDKASNKAMAVAHKYALMQIFAIPTGEQIDPEVDHHEVQEKNGNRPNGRPEMKECPNCGKKAVIKGKSEYGGGWLCWPKRGGCGSKFDDNDPRFQEPGNHTEREMILEDMASLIEISGFSDESVGYYRQQAKDAGPDVQKLRRLLSEMQADAKRATEENDKAANAGFKKRAGDRLEALAANNDARDTSDALEIF